MAAPHNPTRQAQTKARLVEHDSKYYFQEDPMAIFLVENCLFRIHRHYLVEWSEVFRGMFASPAGGSSPEGKSDEQPILLPDVTKREFQALLDYFYLPPHAHTGGGKDPVQTYTDLLSISHRFLFDNIFRYAVGKLQPMINGVPAAQRFTLGQKYGIKDWVISAYETFLDRETTPTAQELEMLGFDKSARLMQARDAMHQRHLQDIKAKYECSRKDEAKANIQRQSMHPYNTFFPTPMSHSSEQVVTGVIKTPDVVRPAAKPFVQQFFK